MLSLPGLGHRAGSKNLRAEGIVRWASATDVSADYLLGITVEPEPKKVDPELLPAVDRARAVAETNGAERNDAAESNDAADRPEWAEELHQEIDNVRLGLVELFDKINRFFEQLEGKRAEENSNPWKRWPTMDAAEVAEREHAPGPR